MDAPTPYREDSPTRSARKEPTRAHASFDALRESIDRLDDRVRKDISFGRSFLLSVVRGIGYTLGATIVASLAVVALTTLSGYLEAVPVIGQYFGTGGIADLSEIIRANMETFLALPRGINVGGKTLSMATLRLACERAGYRNVRSYIRSGNLLVDTDRTDPADIERDLEAVIKNAFGMDVDVLVRDRERLARIVREAPYGDDPNGARVFVAFLKYPPAKAFENGEFERRKRAGESVVLGDGVAYVRYPYGAGRTKIDHAFFERAFSVPVTMRNRNTVETLADRMGIMPPDPADDGEGSVRTRRKAER